jgi:glucose/arabinose dehydrogenase
MIWPRGHSLSWIWAITILVVAAGGVAAQPLRAESYVSGLSMPLGFVQDPTRANTQFVVQQAGLIRVVRSGTLLAQPFLDLSGSISCCSERGLLSLVFSPDYATSRRFFVAYTSPSGHFVVARGRRSAADSDVAETTVFPLVWTSAGDTPYIPRNPEVGNHNGGQLAFGGDGYLYIGTGDGGLGNDPPNNAQTPNVLLGKMLRIDVNVDDADPNGYRVPPDNPFLDGSPLVALPEIWAFGLRNPWRFCFDAGPGGTGALIIADVGQNQHEEINYEPAGAGGRNYGWRNREGAHDNITTAPPAFLPLSDPIWEYSHSDGFSITGGFVYRGSRLGAAFNGRYLFADFSTGRVWSVLLIVDGRGEASVTDLREHSAELGGPGVLGRISSFGVDSAGELYVVNYLGGVVLKVAPILSAPGGVRITSP